MPPLSHLLMNEFSPRAAMLGNAMALSGSPLHANAGLGPGVAASLVFNHNHANYMAA